MRNIYILGLLAVVLNLTFIFISNVYIAFVPFIFSSSIVLTLRSMSEFKMLGKIKRMLMFVVCSTTMAFGIGYFLHINYFPNDLLPTIGFALFFGLQIWLVPGFKRKKRR